MTARRAFDQNREQRLAQFSDRVQVTARLALSMTPEEVRDHYNVDGPLNGVLEDLPLVDRDHARAVYDAMISSPNEAHRMHLTHAIPAIFAIDNEYGYALWDRLIGDPSRTVRRYAYETLAELWDDVADEKRPDDPQVYDDGITWREGSHLLRTYIEAEVEGRRYHLGAVVLTSEVEPISPDGSDPQPPSTSSTAT